MTEQRVLIDDVQAVLQERVQTHRELIRERGEWIKKYRPQPGEAHTFDEQSRYNKRRERWEEQIREAHLKMDEIRKIARLTGVEL